MVVLKCARLVAVVGNGVFVLWLAYNAIDNGFHGTAPEVVSSLVLGVLPVLDSMVLIARS